MAGGLMRLFVNDLDGYQPRIIQLDAPIAIVGMSVDTSLRKIYRDVPALGRRFKALKAAHAITNRKQPWAFAAVSRGYKPTTGEMTYMMGDVVTSLDQIPEGMQAFEIPALQYAIFPVRPKNRFAWGLAIANAKGFAYTEWLPRSGFEPAGVIDDFEYHDARAERQRNPEIDLYVAIRPRSG